jgi:Holliday junction resolvasome RuvABC ATP-dependent DNA helicase subunit
MEDYALDVMIGGPSRARCVQPEPFTLVRRAAGRSGGPLRIAIATAARLGPG